MPLVGDFKGHSISSMGSFNPLYGAQDDKVQINKKRVIRILKKIHVILSEPCERRIPWRA
jgi:hypothetical protein